MSWVGRIWEKRVLPWATDRVTGFADRFRREILPLARGRVLEVGIGSGPSLPFYGQEVTSLVALEPNEGARRALQSRVSREPPPFPVEIVEGKGARLPFLDGAFDTVVFQLVLCSIDDVPAALAEARRILHAEGRLLYLEHIRHSDPRVARRQDLLNPLWRRVTGGCRLNQDTPALLAKAGFEAKPIGEVEDRAWPRFLSHVVWGQAKPVLQWSDSARP